jgi:putative protease
MLNSGVEQMSKKVELLAPAGSMEALTAAVENGADSVYLGGKLFSARQYANNFDEEQIEEAVKYCHLRNIKIYVTVNTLIKNNELKEVIDYVYKLHSYGVDAVIVQDLGLIYILRRILPEIEIHASTQMAVHNLSGAEFLYSQGIKRVVLAREAGIQDIKNIKNFSDIEMEVFVHGALCISFSGQCLMSSLIGGRSGNRGRCAQPCRLEYELTDLEGKKVYNKNLGKYLLSPRDLNTIHYIPQLIKSGVKSLKFEGRMKRPEYVATVIRIYNDAINRYYKNPDNFKVSNEEERELEQIFNRNFTPGHIMGVSGSMLMSYKRPNNRGVYLGRVKDNPRDNLALINIESNIAIGDGVEFWVTKGGRKGVEIDKILKDTKLVEKADSGSLVYINSLPGVKKGDRVFKTHDEKLISEAKKSYIMPSKSKISLQAKFYAVIGEPIKLMLKDDMGNEIEVLSDYIAERAINKKTTKELLWKQLGRLGNTSFVLKDLFFSCNDNIMIPLSELNSLRREAVKKLEKSILQKYKTNIIDKKTFREKRDEIFKKSTDDKETDKITLSVHVGDFESYSAALKSNVDEIYLMCEPYKGKKLNDELIYTAVLKAKERGKKIILSLPRFILSKEEKHFFNLLEKIILYKPDGVLAGNLGVLEAVKKFAPSLKIYGDYWLNIFNNSTVQYLREIGLEKVTFSPELKLEEISKFNFKYCSECIVHGSIPVMTTKYCAIGALVNSNKECQEECTKNKFALRDKKNYLFPIETDKYCRMYLFNSRELCLLENINEILMTGIKNLRLELIRESPQKTAKIIDMYSEVIACPEKIDKYKNVINNLYPEGITKGHYFRGVE